MVQRYCVGAGGSRSGRVLRVVAAGFSVAQLRRPSPDCHLAVFGVPTDECGLGDVEGEDGGGLGWSRRPPAFPAFVPDLLVGLRGLTVELEFSLAAVGVDRQAGAPTTGPERFPNTAGAGSPLSRSRPRSFVRPSSAARRSTPATTPRMRRCSPSTGSSATSPAQPSCRGRRCSPLPANSERRPADRVSPPFELVAAETACLQVQASLLR